MGNGSSHSIVLGPPRFQSPDFHRGIPKYAHPQNRVLPKPIAGQRLRSTDNGSILQAAGTIRGQRSGPTEKHLDPEVVQILRGRSERIVKENDCDRHCNLRNHRMFNSDPNIARRPGEVCQEDFQEAYTSRRSCGGAAAVRASKLRYKKKTRAPEPPPTQSSYSHDDSRMDSSGLACKCISKPRAPQPPAIVIHPPPPPPMPNTVTTRTKIGTPPFQPRSEAEKSTRPITRAVESDGNKTTYEKNIHPLEKWRSCRSTCDIRLDEDDERPASRTTVFDSKKLSDSQSKIPSYLPQKPDPFQKEIQAVTQKIAESRQQVFSYEKMEQNIESKAKEPPKFYFSDPGVFKPISKSNKSIEKTTSSEVSKSSENATIDEVMPTIERFSPARRRFKLPNSPTTPKKTENSLPKSLFQKQNGDSDIDIRLRPVLPRKLPDVPKFSPSEAWQALGSDGMGSSNHSTSDDGPDSFSAYKQNLQRVNDVSRNRSDHYVGNGFKHNSVSDSQWTPRQDLLDDSDVSSEEAIVPRMTSGLGEISTRFSLPSVMFSNMRPIGSEMKSSSAQPSFLNDGAKPKRKNPNRKDLAFDSTPGTNFGGFLSKRNKYLSEEDVTVSNSNWTFGLQKRGKQYSSDIMLSDKKKYELMAHNHFGDFLGDILVSKANHMRKQMKTSESGNSSFSFYSTDGQIMYNPEKGGFVKEEECFPPTRGRVYDMRRRFDAIADASRLNFGFKSSKKKVSDFDLSRRRDLELAKMLEDEVRRRRNKEKISIRQQLQRMKHLQSDDEDDFDDEAYFTEHKSREDSQSPFFNPGRTAALSELGTRQTRLGEGPSVTATDSSHLSHWQSSPALLEDSLMKTNMHLSTKSRLSLSSVTSSPGSAAWVQSNRVVDTWLQRQQKIGLDNLKQTQSTLGGRLTASEQENDGNVSSSPTPAPTRKERRKTNIYKQLMDIVRKEERHLKKSQGAANSRESSCSHRESSPSTCSESSSSSSYSSSSQNHPKNGVPANKEFGYRTPSFQVAFVQPYSSTKSFRPVHFDVVNTSCRLPGLQEEGKQLQTEVS